MSDKVYYHKHHCPCCDRDYDCVLKECEYRDGKEETCSYCWMVGIGRERPDNVRAVVTYAQRQP